MKMEEKKKFKFDVIIGNPPYQEEQESTDFEESKKNYAPSIYNLFMDAAYEIGNKVELIHPARFLFNAGNTPKAWNKKILEDSHIKVVFYEPDSDKVFPGLQSPIKGGVAVTYRDNLKQFGAIGIFTQYSELNSIIKLIHNNPDFKSLMDIVYSRTSYRLTDKLHHDYPEAITQLSKGHAYDMASNIMERLPYVFLKEKPVADDENYIRILGREGNHRTYRYIKRSYVRPAENLDNYKVCLPQAQGNGIFGEKISKPFVEPPRTGTTETFISIGNFKNKVEADNLCKYVCTKLARALLGVLKVTQNGNKPVWAYVPLQDFTSHSDIDWSQSIPDIDKQLYKKYGLSQEEIDFIESHVKEMA